MFEVQELDAFTDFDEKLWLTIIDTVTVHADGQMTFKFQGGKTLAFIDYSLIMLYNRYIPKTKKGGRVLAKTTTVPSDLRRTTS